MAPPRAQRPSERWCVAVMTPSPSPIETTRVSAATTTWTVGVSIWDGSTSWRAGCPGALLDLGCGCGVPRDPCAGRPRPRRRRPGLLCDTDRPGSPARTGRQLRARRHGYLGGPSVVLRRGDFLLRADRRPAGRRASPPRPHGRWLRPGGWALLIVGSGRWRAVAGLPRRADVLGACRRNTYLRWLRDPTEATARSSASRSV